MPGLAAVIFWATKTLPSSGVIAIGASRVPWSVFKGFSVGVRRCRLIGFNVNLSPAGVNMNTTLLGYNSG